MTIVAGFTCNDGVVLCSDSQITISGYTKEYDGKVRLSLYRSGFSIAIAGAGDGDYIRMAMDKACAGIEEKSRFLDIVGIIEENLLRFFDTHLARWSGYADAERPSVELLIAISCTNGGFGLFHYVGTSFHRVLGAKAIGAGILLANSLIHPYTFGLKTLEDLSSAAVYILYKVKKQVDTCGGFTDLVVLRKRGKAAIVPSHEIEKLERDYQRIESDHNESLKQQIISKRLPPFWYFGEKKPTRMAPSKNQERTHEIEGESNQGPS